MHKYKKLTKDSVVRYTTGQTPIEVYERDRPLQLLQNDRYPKIEANGWVDRLVLHRELVMIRIAPTYSYWKGNMETGSALWYSASIKEQAGGEKMNIEPGSPFHRIQMSYQSFDEQVKELAYPCLEGCSQCCSDVFYVSEVEFFYLLAELIQKKQYVALYRCYQKAKLQEAFLKENFPPVYHQILDDYEPTDNRYYNLGFTIQTAISCPLLNRKGRCVAYKNRPAICRLYGTTKTCSMIGNPSRLHLEHFLEYEKIFCLEEKVQPRPIWYYAVEALKRENLPATLQKIKMYTTAQF